LFRRCLRRLRHICGHHNVLPSSHIISDGLRKSGDSPVAFGGFADVWEGTFAGEKVCVKVLRVYNANTNNQKGPLAVCGIREFIVCLTNTDTAQAFLRGSSCLEEAETCKCCAFFGCYDGAVTARVEVDAQRHIDGIRERQTPR